MSEKVRVVNTKNAAEILGLAEGTLRQTRMNGKRNGRIPPIPFIRVGRKILYRICDLEQWLAEHMVCADKKASE